MIVNPDYSECKTKTCPPEGAYIVRIMEWQNAERPDRDDFPQLQWKLRVQHESPEFDGYEFTHYTSIGGPFAWTTRQIVQAVNPAYSTGPFDPKDLVGKDIELNIQRVQKQTGEWSRYPRARDIRPYVNKGTVSPMGVKQNLTSESALQHDKPPF